MMEKGDVPLQDNPARYRSLPFIFSGVLLLLSYGLNQRQMAVRNMLSAEFNWLPFISFSVIAPLLFALFSLPLFASVFNHRLTPTGSLILLLAGLLVGLLPVWTVFTGLGILMQATVSGYLPLAGAFIAAAGFGGLVLPEKTV
ncbi:MAG: hypothetical protein ACYDHA_06055 [Bellilinea sp.]